MRPTQLEEQTISRYIEMCNQAKRASDEAERMADAAAEFGYLAATQFPDFIDHVAEKSKTEPKEVISDILLKKHIYLGDEERRKNENSRHWLQRLEAAAMKRKNEEEQKREAERNARRVAGDKILNCPSHEFEYSKNRKTGRCVKCDFTADFVDGKWVGRFHFNNGKWEKGRRNWFPPREQAA